MTDQVFLTTYGWHFWDEHGLFFYGPYATEDEARAALADYMKKNGL